MAKKTVAKIAAKEAEINVLEQKLSWWETTKAWFKHSETILLNRLEVAFGFIVGSIGMFDWSPLLTLFGTDTGFSFKQTAALGSVMIVRGTVGEILRRRGANM